MKKHTLFLILSLGLAPQKAFCYSFATLKTSIANKFTTTSSYIPAFVVLGAGVAGYYVGRNSNSAEYIEQMCANITCSSNVGETSHWYQQEFGMIPTTATRLAQAHYDHVHAEPSFMHNFSAGLSAACVGASGFLQNTTKEPFKRKVATIALAATAFGLAYAAGVYKNLDQALHA